MNKMLLFCLLFVLAIVSCADRPSPASDGRFTNPILAGFFPDPSICRVGEDYYLVTSTFSYFPGIPIFHSSDLVNWELIGHVLQRPEQLNLDGQGVSRGIFAPAIRHHGGVFYVTSTLVDIGGNFVVTADSPQGPWSNPVWIPQIDGIDPSLFFDNDDKAYIVYNSVAPDPKPLYDGHRTIRMYEFDTQQLAVIGEETLLIDGGTDIRKKPVWIEAPHIFKKEGFYYLIAAEGGTAENHSEVVFRSSKVKGPYHPYEKNPILTQRHLDPKRENPVTCTGHADFVQTPSGEWWAVFLGCRPYPPVDQNFYNTGRETFLAPIEWTAGWPIINPDHAEVQYRYPLPLPPSPQRHAIPHSGNFVVRDDFAEPKLDPNWMFLRTPHETWHDLDSRPGFLSMQVRPESCAGERNPSFLGRRQQHLQGEASVSLHFNPTSDNEKAGLLIFQNETHYYFLCKSKERKNTAVQLYRSATGQTNSRGMELITSQTLDAAQNDRAIHLKIKAQNNAYHFYYAFASGDWIALYENADASFLSTRTAGGFVGCIYALYSTSSGQASQNRAHFDWFEYAGADRVYF